MTSQIALTYFSLDEMGLPSEGLFTKRGAGYL
jgi:hypothetical protein